MGTIQLGAVIVVFNGMFEHEYQKFNALYAKTQEDVQRASETVGFSSKGLLTPLAMGINGCTSFALLPCGSKLGWQEHNQWVQAKDKIVSEFRALGCDVIEVSWGELGKTAQINDAILTVV